MVDSSDPFFWSGVDDQEVLSNQQQKLNRQDQLAISHQFAKCFNTEAGKAVLAKLESMTITIPSWTPEHQNPLEFGLMREGQNSLVWHIKERIEESLNAHKED